MQFSLWFSFLFQKAGELSEEPKNEIKIALQATEYLNKGIAILACAPADYEALEKWFYDLVINRKTVKE